MLLRARGTPTKIILCQLAPITAIHHEMKNNIKLRAIISFSFE